MHRTLITLRILKLLSEQWTKYVNIFMRLNPAIAWHVLRIRKSCTITSSYRRINQANQNITENVPF
jgi:hypothetical protein